MIEADEIRRRMPAIIAGEVACINRTLAGTRPNRQPPAKTSENWTVVAGRSFVAYGLRRDPTVLPQDIEKLIPTLREALSSLRRRPTVVRLRYMPLALEVAHPFPAPLDWHKARTALDADTMLTGRNYSGGEPVDDVLRFDDTPHVLIAGTTGSGKSTLLRMMIATLALNTSPANLRLYLVDLKNTDLKPFRRLPHTELFAGEENEARQVIRIVHREVRRRKDTEDTAAPRIVLVIDELAEVGDKDTLDLLSSILRIGRSFRVNVVAATQLPTKATCGEKNNYTVRFVGAVTDPQTAALAAGRGESGAHLLPGKGAFLRVEGTTLERLQAYHLDMPGTASMVQQAVQRWGKRAVSAGYRGGEQAVRGGATTGEQPVRDDRHTGEALVTPPVMAQEWQFWGETTPAHASPVSTPRVPVAVAARPTPELLPNAVYPLGKTRELTPTEVAIVRRWRAEGVSGNVICERIFGPKNQQRLDIIRRAIEGGTA